jgi:hypothetical protein
LDIQEQEANAMPNDPENLNPQEPADSTFAETPEQKKINRIANEAAAKAGKREKVFGQSHGAFPRSGPSGMA